MLRTEFYFRLLRTKKGDIDFVRNVWKKLFKFEDYYSSCYDELKKSTMQNRASLGKSSDIIRLDVERSDLNIPNVSHISKQAFAERMTNVLLVYSSYDHDVEYC